MEFNIENFIKPNIKNLKPYKALRDDLTDENLIFLEANENPYGIFNRYPDSTHQKLREKLAKIKEIPIENIFIGNGSDELIDLLIRAFCEPNKDAIMTMQPSFAMYSVYAEINQVQVENLNLDENFNLSKTAFDEINQNSKSKILFLCSPNNPTGNSIQNIAYFVENFNGIVVIDEAYIEFSTEKSAKNLLQKYPNLVVLHTLSKAWSLAGARIGIGMASKEIAALIQAIKPPYNVSSLSQEAAINQLSQPEIFEKNLKIILEERERLRTILPKIACVKKVFPTDANFFLIQFFEVEKVYQSLLENQILTSLRHPNIKNCIRINIGTPEENQKLIEILEKINK